MGYSQVALEDKLLDMYPDIAKNGFVPLMSFDQQQNTWVVKLKKGIVEFTVKLSKTGADACMDGTFCEDFGAEIAQKLQVYTNCKM